MQGFLDVWRAIEGRKEIQRIFQEWRPVNSNAKNKIYEADRFLWPNRHDLEFRVRVNTESALRTIGRDPDQRSRCSVCSKEAARDQR